MFDAVREEYGVYHEDQSRTEQPYGNQFKDSRPGVFRRKIYNSFFFCKRSKIRPENIANEAVARKELYKKLSLFIYEQP